MARTRKQIYTMQQYLDNVREGYVDNDASIQRFPAYKPIIDGLAVTILTHDYIPPIILAEEENGRTVIVDGGSRTAAFMMIRYGNYKIKSSVENPIIQYKKKDNDESGKVVWSDAEFDIRNKTYEQFPKELQKIFDEYQVETVIHECNADIISMYFRRYNIHTGMNANQKMFIYLPKFAEQVRSISKKRFFLDYSNIENTKKEKGILERIISESVMLMFHFDKWNKNGKKLSTYLNDNATKFEFEHLNDNISRLEKVITDDTKCLFNTKDTFIWLTLFDKFTKLRVEDSKFGDFLNAFVSNLKNKPVDGKLFNRVDDSGSTKDKSVIIAKLHILETLMHDFLGIDEKDLEEIDVLQFVRENVNADVTEEDIEQCVSELDDLTLNVDNSSNLLDERNKPSFIALIAYSFEKDISLEDWIVDFFKRNSTYKLNQKENYIYMKKDFDKYIIKNAC